MKIPHKESPKARLACTALFFVVLGAWAQENAPPPPPEPAEAAQLPPEPPQRPRGPDREWRRGNAIVSIGRDSNLAAGERAEAVVSVMGSSTSAGEVAEAVVSIFGNSTATGPVGESVVSIFGNTYVNSRVDDEAVAVFGSVELGPEADVRNVVAVFGEIKRDPQAIVRGKTDSVVVGRQFDFAWLRAWVDHALLYGRPLALAPGLNWAWWLAGGFLALYVLLALAAREGIERCVRTLETRPGRSLLAALLTLLLTPIAFVLLAITIVGIAVIPFLAIALFCAGLFGKAVMLAWIGRRCTKPLGLNSHVAVAVLIGGLLVLAIYLVPVLGFIVYKALGILGLGVVTYTLIQSVTPKREPSVAPAAGPAAPTETASSNAAAEPAQPQSSASPNSTAASATAAATTALPRAGFWIRMGALVIDLILTGIVSAVVDLHVLLLLAAYGAVMWKLRGTTIGGIVCHLQIVRLDGREIDWATAIVRALSCFVSLVVAGLGFFWIAFDDERQAWHDKIAGTVVVRTPKGVSLL